MARGNPATPFSTTILQNTINTRQAFRLRCRVRRFSFVTLTQHYGAVSLKHYGLILVSGIRLNDVPCFAVRVSIVSLFYFNR
jgi:hypothetical protein